MFFFHNKHTKRPAKFQHKFSSWQNSANKFQWWWKQDLYINFSDRHFFDMNRKLRSTNSSCKIKEEQINYLPEDIEKNIEE